MLLQPADVRVAAEEPEQLDGDGLEVHLLRRHEREALGQVEAHLVAEHAHRAGPGAVALRRALVSTWRDEVLVLGHESKIARNPAVTPARNRAAACGVPRPDDAIPHAARAADAHMRERARRASASIRAPVRPRRRARRDDLLPRPLTRADPPAVHGAGSHVIRKVAGARELAGLALAAGRDAVRGGSAERTDPAHPTRRAGRHCRRRCPMPVDLVVDPAGSTLWVASIAEGVGLVQVDVASGSVEPFAAVRTAARGGADRRRRLRRPRRPRGQQGGRCDGSRDAAREGRRVQGRRRPKRCCLRSDGWAERWSGRAHLAERSGRARRRNGPARPAPRRASAGSADAPERRRARAGRKSARRADRAGAGDPARRTLRPVD